MVDLIKWLHDLIKDKGTRWFTKLVYIVTILSIIYVVDDYYGWSYYAQANRKVELLKNINECLRDSTNTSQEIAFLNQEKFKLLNRKTFANKCLFNVGIFFTKKQSQKNTWKNIKFEFFYGKEVVPIYRFLLINTGMFIICLFESIKITRLKVARNKKISAIIIIIVAFALVSVGYTFFLSFLPVLWENNIWINYVIYFIIGAYITRHSYIEKMKGTFIKAANQ